MNFIYFLQYLSLLSSNYDNAPYKHKKNTKIIKNGTIHENILILSVWCYNKLHLNGPIAQLDRATDF